MNSVMRHAWTLFFSVPLQRWTNALGLLLALSGIGVLLLYSDDLRPPSGGMALMVVGLVIIGVVPALLGGVALRSASTRTVLHLRPHGRVKMLLAATLVLTVLAGLLTFAELFPSTLYPKPPTSREIDLESIWVFSISWSVLAITWIGFFAMSRSPLAIALMGLSPMLVVYLLNHGRHLLPSPAAFVSIGVGAWVLFALWYLRTQSVHRVTIAELHGAGTGMNGNLLMRFAHVGGPSGAPTRKHAEFHLLFGVASPRFFFAIGGWVAFIFLMLVVFTTRRGLHGTTQLLTMLPFVAFFNASLGYATASRGRLLWLRGGMNRDEMFRLAEVTGLRSAFSAWVVTAGVVVGYSVFTEGMLTSGQMLFLLLQAIVGGILFYTGLSSIRRWSFLEILRSVVITTLFIVQAFTLAPGIKSRNDPSLDLLFAEMGVAIVLLLLLRWQTRRRWQQIDWRVAKISKWGMGA